MDGWGEVENGILHDNHESDKEGWDDIEPLEELKPPPELASIQAAQKRPFAQPKPHAEQSSRVNSSIATKQSSSTFAIAKPQSAKPAIPGEDRDTWGSIAASPPQTTSKPFKSAGVVDDDPWLAIAAAPPVTKVKPLSSGRGRGGKQTPMKLGAQRIDRTS
ncbi:hypothetical protein KSP39_PZI004002 [Platanthera zijinensis]|uniref:Uncharacterized protein n=1 Tax=Platanthera zijinensis TaxID=2320716 RepID=A0AAP0BWK1_9ASPA